MCKLSHDNTLNIGKSTCVKNKLFAIAKITRAEAQGHKRVENVKDEVAPTSQREAKTSWAFSLWQSTHQREARVSSELNAVMTCRIKKNR